MNFRNLDDNPPLQEISQNQQANNSNRLTSQRRENFRNNSRKNHIKEFLDSKRKSQQSQLEEDDDFFDFDSCLNEFKKTGSYDTFCSLRIFYQFQKEREIKVQYQTSLKEYIISLQNYDPAVITYLISFLMEEERFETNLDFVRALFNIINDQQCFIIHENCLVLIYLILNENPDIVLQMKDCQNDFKKLFTSRFQVCSNFKLRFIIKICKILKLNNIKYLIPEKEPNIKIFFLKCIEFGDPETIYDSLFLLDCLTSEQRSQILGEFKQMIFDAYKISPTKTEIQSEDLFKTILYGASNTNGQVKRFYLNATFVILDLLDKNRLAVQFLKLLWPIIYDIQMAAEKHDFELGELRIILKILFYATSLNLSPEYGRCFEEILSLSIDPDILQSITRLCNRAIEFF